MTRQDRKAKNAITYPSSVVEVLNEVTDSIYDDFESRTCANCKHGSKGEEYLGECYYCGFGMEFLGSDVLDHDFGCNKFERTI